jgi:hypothetical protein
MFRYPGLAPFSSHMVWSDPLRRPRMRINAPEDANLFHCCGACQPPFYAL